MGLVQIEDRGSVRHVVMTRSEKRNAMNGEMVLALGDAFREAQMDDSVRVVVVRGDGPMFSSGMDLGSLADLSSDPSGLRPFRAEVLRVMAEDAVTGLLETRIGLLPDVGGCSRLPAVVGLGIAKELIMTGRVIDVR